MVTEIQEVKETQEMDLEMDRDKVVVVVVQEMEVHQEVKMVEVVSKVEVLEETEAAIRKLRTTKKYLHQRILIPKEIGPMSKVMLTRLDKRIL
ncbi:hypothetical protein R9X47_01185 [Wukongibacter baidiensis]|uniref:hypothetical protein n=1 Tax=Wukongibacter baidiensis TaxID=1723361 RepID=UPI003D7F3592